MDRTNRPASDDRWRVVERMLAGWHALDAAAVIDCFADEGWWVNIRKSNTEPLLRLNAEARDKATLDKIVEEIAPMLGQQVAH